MNAHTLANGPILSTLLRLSIPNVIAMLVAALVVIAETWYVGRLGTVSLAAMALVFPFSMLTQMMSAGAMGGGVSSAISRALGASDAERAHTLAVHALVIGVVIGILYAATFIAFGPALYRLLGGKDDVLAQAIAFSDVLFIGAAGVWLMNTLASVLRGTGNMRVPSVTILVSSAMQIAIGGALGLGVEALAIPRLGLPGVAVGTIAAFYGGSAFLLWYLLTGQGRLTLKFRGVRLQWPMFSDILKVGALACLSSVQLVLAVLVITGLVARLGLATLAGYSIGQRLEFLLVPVAFGIGVASVPMVGIAIGEGNIIRAREIAWTAAMVSAINLALIGGIVTVWPQLWAGIFSADPAVLASAQQYLQTVGPAFAFFGFGLTLYFASQGSGKILGPVLASTTRLIVVAAVGSWLSASSAGPQAMFALVAAAMVVYGAATGFAVRVTSWRSAPSGSR
jgi:putative MATE family efflux protein